ncbi:PBP1A family penicillin-binding protein [Sphingomonas sp. ABOLD]|uniref:Penicillin-binding protein 1A n=2 Tax=Sphingomonas TaxID=13687 RepID=A0A7X6BC10_9SPHN|nr:MULTISPECIES: PBP1A family penicillin-binding protein [Sphingomonas]NJB96137.1 penicillin-binding protein 1A [Sphingomonas trueperi]RSV44904.1 PBP1A family penicillin-binding protein [Sphingomonas sp. ABOLE]RSV51099.1 PBP1A family penicillin-binding protein [Sphingomonas sp. ABOLD]
MAVKSKTAAAPWWRRGSFWKKFFLWSLISGVALALIACIALVIAVYSARSTLPSFDQMKSSPNGQMIRVHAVDGTVLVSLGPSYGEWIKYDQIPQAMKDAIIATEDRRFESHWGVDPVGVARIFWVAKRLHDEGRRLQGGSTITQQVARTIFLSNKYSVTRKIREAILALALERKFSKQEILELYLNKVYFGGGAYGIDAASRKFFGHPATNLSLGESAIIAGLVKAPSHYSPTADAEAAVDRATVVLKLMAEAGKISEAQANSTDPHAVQLAPEPKQNSVRYFTDWALPQLETLIDETDAPLDVWTTLDLNMQRSADQAIRVNAPDGAQGALVSIDRDGAVRAMVGGKDYVSSIYNRATQAQRQPGSSFKLFVYLAALEAGHKPDDVVVDEPVTIDGWTPRNDSRRNSGPITIRTAFAYSVNTIAAKLGQEVGFTTVADMAKRFGITTPINTQPAMVLGTSNVRLIDMTRAFASVGNNGVAVTPYGITRVTANNRVIYQHEVDTSHVLVANYVAAQMIDLMQTAVATGTGRAAQIGRPVAGKTGTTSSNKDGWFIGFSSGLTTGVWMGRDDAKVVPGLQGGRAPARAFHDFMIQAVANRPVEQFETQLTPPDNMLEPDEDAYGAPDNGMMVDPDGNPIAPPPQVPIEPQDDEGMDGTDPVQQGGRPAPVQQQGERLDRDWINRMTGRPPAQQQQQPRQPQRQPAPQDRQRPNDEY